MLQNQGTESSETDNLKGKPFPCPVCGMILPIGISQKQKPYCVCNFCGIQLFIRGKTGIKRLHAMLENEERMEEYFPEANIAVNLYNRLQDVKRKRDELEQKQGIIFRDENLDNAIAALNADIDRLEIELEAARRQSERRK